LFTASLKRKQPDGWNLYGDVRGDVVHMHALYLQGQWLSAPIQY